MKRRLRISVWVSALSMAVVGLPCSATVQYSFSGLNVAWGVADTFTYDSPAFVTNDVTLAPDQLTPANYGHYSIPGTAYNPPQTSSVQGAFLWPSSPGWGTAPGTVLEVGILDGIANPDFYFPLAATREYGVYTTLMTADDPEAFNTGTLSVQPVSSDVPETVETIPVAVVIGGLISLGRSRGQRFQAE